MVARRIIPCLDVRAGQVTKGIEFRGNVDIGDPVAMARRYYEEGHFPPGNMGPKVKAAMRFAERTGNIAIITSLDKVVEALEGKTGTRIIPK